VADDNETGVISDIDDTLLVSHSTKFIRKIALQLFKNAHSRKPIPLLENWLGYLKDLNDAYHPRDFFYVSNSEWNLYDFLIHFFELNNLPKGVFLLQNLKRGIKDFVKSGKSHGSHKTDSIEFLMRFYPNKRFILVGDNGQKDMEIYHKVVSEFADRIKGVMIRKLPYVKNDVLIRSYKEKINAFNVPFMTFQ
jgi:phosphatidate phosphatase APP1